MTAGYLVALGALGGLVFGVLGAVLAGETDSVGRFITAVLVRGVPFGAFQAVLLGFLVRYGTSDETRCGRSRAGATVELPRWTRPAALELCTHAPAALSRAGTAEVDEAAGCVRFSIGPGIRSFGERVRLQVTQEGPGATVAVHSCSSVRWTLLDWGRNRDNVRCLTAWHEAAVGERTAGDASGGLPQ